MHDRSRQFFDAKCKFERAATKWIFGQDAEFLPEPKLQQEERLRLQ